MWPSLLTHGLWDFLIFLGVQGGALATGVVMPLVTAYVCNFRVNKLRKLEADLAANSFVDDSSGAGGGASAATTDPEAAFLAPAADEHARNGF